MLSELDPMMMNLSCSLLDEMELNLNITVKNKASKAISRFIDEFINDLVTLSGYGMKTEPTENEAQYCIQLLWRKFQLRLDILSENQLDADINDGFSLKIDGSSDSDSGSEYSADMEDLDSDSTVSDSDTSSDTEDDEQNQYDDDDDASNASELNLDLVFDNESMLETAQEEAASSLTVSSEHQQDMEATPDFVSLFIQYFTHMMHHKYHTEFVMKPSIAILFARFLSRQVQLSIENNSDSLFIRAGYPAFGIMHSLYATQEELRRTKELVEAQAQLIQNMQHLRQEFSSSADISQNISSVVRNLHSEGYQHQHSQSSNISGANIHVQQRHEENHVESTDAEPTFFTPNRKHPFSTQIDTNANKTIINNTDNQANTQNIEELQTALKTERQTNFYLRLRHEELKLVMGRLNDLVYGTATTNTAAANDTNHTTTNNSNNNDNINHGTTMREWETAVESDVDTEDEYSTQKPPPMGHSSAAAADSRVEVSAASLSKLAQQSFSPPPHLLRHSLKRPFHHEPQDDTAENNPDGKRIRTNNTTTTTTTVSSKIKTSQSQNNQRPSPTLRYSYDYEAQDALMTGTIDLLRLPPSRQPNRSSNNSATNHSHLTAGDLLVNNENNNNNHTSSNSNNVPIRQRRRAWSLHARQQGPHTPTLFDR